MLLCSFKSQIFQRISQGDGTMLFFDCQSWKPQKNPFLLQGGIPPVVEWVGAVWERDSPVVSPVGGWVVVHLELWAPTTTTDHPPAYWLQAAHRAAAHLPDQGDKYKYKQKYKHKYKFGKQFVLKRAAQMPHQTKNRLPTRGEREWHLGVWEWIIPFPKNMVPWGVPEKILQNAAQTRWC